jgi:hypothetical protein
MVKKLKKKVINVNELTDFIKLLQLKYPPTNNKFIKQAFQHFIEQYPEILSSTQWLVIYQKNKSSKNIAEHILNTPKIRINNYDIASRIGRGGSRGKSKTWEKYLIAGTVVMSPNTIIKAKKWNVNPLDVIYIMQSGKQNMANPETKKAIAFFNYFYTFTLKEFIDLCDLSNKKHISAIKYYFGKDHPVIEEIKHIIGEKNPLLESKGKQITKRSFHNSITEVWNYMHGKNKKRKSEDFYRNKKFYYIVWLTSFITNLFDMDYSLKKNLAVIQITNILSSFDYKAKVDIVKAIFDEL